MRTRGLSISRVLVDGAQEPVTLDDLKSFVAIDFEDHDQLLENCLLSAREEVEGYTGLTLVDSNYTVRWQELTERPLPYPPVKSITSIQDKLVDGEDLTEVTIDDLYVVTANRIYPTVIKYLAGYGDDVPNALRLAVMKCAADHFTHRSGISLDQNAVAKLPNDWKSVAKRHSVKSWLA
ncbi:head-tail connector protein [Pedobacter sp.]|uniref:head-tail connector protein n=1 Tax=Pedobacter sp. TaxID=1411316 RepID=UPI003C4319F4